MLIYCPEDFWFCSSFDKSLYPQPVTHWATLCVRVLGAVLTVCASLPLSLYLNFLLLVDAGNNSSVGPSPVMLLLLCCSDFFKGLVCAARTLFKKSTFLSTLKAHFKLKLPKHDMTANIHFIVSPPQISLSLGAHHWHLEGELATAARISPHYYCMGVAPFSYCGFCSVRFSYRVQLLSFSPLYVR